MFMIKKNMNKREDKHDKIGIRSNNRQSKRG